MRSNLKKKRGRLPEEIKPNQETDKKEKVFQIFLIVFLFGFGVYQSFLYWGHQPVPHFDFNCFAQLGHEILNFQNPGSYKRPPLVGVLQVLLGKISGGTSPDFTGGWLLNSILHPFNGLLIFLIGKKLIGKEAFWLALIAMLNPWALQLLTEAIVETSLLFGFLITFYFIIRRSNWCYLFASITTMIRYEGAGLILIAFLVDMVEAKNNKKRLLTFLYSFIASIPLGIWMLGTFINWKPGTTHYLSELGQQSGGKIIFVQYLQLTWEVGFSSLFMLRPTASQNSFSLLSNLSEFIVAASFVFGSIYGIYRKNWNIPAMVLFLGLYLLVHAIHSWSFQRFITPVAWMPLLICFYGLKSLWNIINKNNRLPRIITLLLQAVILVVAICWTMEIIPYFDKLAGISKKSVSVPFIAMGIVVLVFLGRIYIYRLKYALRELSTAAFVILIITSNHFVVAGVVGNGERDIEFKYLLDWYLANAKHSEKMVLTVPIILQTMAPEYKDCFIHTDTFDANNPTDFVRECYKRNITYVTWDSRMGLYPDNRYYKYWKMSNIAPLIVGKDIGPYQFITRLGVNQGRYVNLYRLRYPPHRN